MTGQARGQENSAGQDEQGEKDGFESAVDWVKASFSELCACWFKKIIKDIFVVLMSLPSTFSGPRTLTDQPRRPK